MRHLNLWPGRMPMACTSRSLASWVFSPARANNGGSLLCKRAGMAALDMSGETSPLSFSGVAMYGHEFTCSSICCVDNNQPLASQLLFMQLRIADFSLRRFVISLAHDQRITVVRYC